MKLDTLIPIGALLSIIGVAGIVYLEKEHPIQCLDMAKVKSINRVIHRSAEIEFTDGRIVTLQQPSIRPGDNYCVKHARRWD